MCVSLSVCVCVCVTHCLFPIKGVLNPEQIFPPGLGYGAGRGSQNNLCTHAVLLLFSIIFSGLMSVGGSEYAEDGCALCAWQCICLHSDVLTRTLNGPEVIKCV